MHILCIYTAFKIGVGKLTTCNLPTLFTVAFPQMSFLPYLLHTVIRYI